MENQNFDILSVIKNPFELAQYFYENNKTFIAFTNNIFYVWNTEQTLWLEKSKMI